MTTPSFLIVDLPCDMALQAAKKKLSQSGLRALQTFDLHTARLTQQDCPCPHHGTSQCNCQMVVLLVYQGEHPPATLVIHGNDDTSWFYLINMPQQPIGQHLEKNIQEALSLEIDAKA